MKVVVPRSQTSLPTPIRDVAIAKTLDPTQQSDVLGGVDSKKTAMYVLLAAWLSMIKEGSPSVARGAVLRREALELALYSFRYLDNTDSVVAFFPPQKGKDVTHAYFFAKPGALEAQLDPSRCG